MLLKLCQIGGNPSVSCTRNRSFVGANHVSRYPPFVAVTLEMPGNGFTSTANVFVSLNAGTPPAVTIVVSTLLVPACARSGVHVITPFVALITGTFGPVTVLVRV